ncbi:hypothetical protein BCR35DRAFT_330057 [Leucosporidium creatinivorum]|uniref:F-box domain-containing protein n=1 Tax=Leucosporidium creatinivorum TaxID=106004 RepID=A0A1Y2FW31_9BASI|nr:hypothetical protein BCR35DRAFT_330057 [Leucosporidium creatinivorum]
MVVPPLPVEIVEHIIKQSLPPLRFETFKERYELLRTYSLVDSRWRVLAQKELGRHLVVTNEGWERLKEAIHDSKSFGRQAQSVWATARYLFPGEKPKILALVKEVLDRSELPHLTLSWTNLNGDMELFEQGRSLRSCTLHYSDLTFHQTAPTIRHLKSLYLVDPYFYDGDGEWLSFLNPTSFPSLCRLQLLRTNRMGSFNEHRSDPRNPSGITHSILALAPRLEALAICEAHQPSIANSLSAQEWPLFSELQHLTLNTIGDPEKETSWLQTLEHLPPNLESLTILILNPAELEVRYHDIEAALRGWEDERWRLYIRILDQKVDEGEDEVEDEEAEARTSLIRTATERGVKVEIGSSKATNDDWETFFDDYSALE